ncbi:hypothetical protein [Maribacter aquivivus]|uniref:hypothetical protein n=1 Tax=Maribacter aquivivus TaxID=228958 RepID=UPI00249576F2|nr:hypothetical protein [Maribacter aquivivus]
MKKYILIDSGYWFGLYDKSDSYHVSANAIADLIEDYKIIVPYPSMYEILNSKFIKDKSRLTQFEEAMKSDRVEFVFDEGYREKALTNTYSIHRKPIPQISLVDSIIREIIKDINIKIDFVVTFNEKDFKDVCDIRNIKIISE